MKARCLWSFTQHTSTLRRVFRSLMHFELMLPIREIAAFSCGNSRYLSAIAQELADKPHGVIHQDRILKVADIRSHLMCRSRENVSALHETGYACQANATARSSNSEMTK